MRLAADELAGTVDLFGAMTREELATAVEELAFRGGTEFDAAAHETAVAEAIQAYCLVEAEVEALDEPALVVGPAAFPTLPEHGADLPHIVELPERSVDLDAVGIQVEERMRREAAKAVSEEDVDRMRTLLDASYELEAWAPVEVAEVRARLTDALEGV